MSADLLRRLRECDGAAEGPWYVSGDDAADCPDHANSGLAMVDTGRHSDWPVARLCEWPTARLIALAPELRDEVLRLRRLIADISRLDAPIESLCEAQRIAEESKDATT